MFQQCRHILPSGERCRAAALRGQQYCYFHNKLHSLSNPTAGEMKSVAMPPIEDASGIQLALAQVLSALTSPSIDTRRARLMLYGLQIAAQVLSRSGVKDPAQPVRTVSSDENGNELAPEKLVCEPGIDCARCRNREECSNYEDPEEEEEQFEPEEDEEEDGEDAIEDQEEDSE